MRFKLIILLIIFSWIPVNLIAGIKVYLLPKTEISSMDICVKDIAKFEGNVYEIEKIKNININQIYYNDGFIDKRELRSIIAPFLKTGFIIYGASTFITENDDFEKPEVKRGEPVRIILERNGIRVEVDGIAGEKGKLGDSIKVNIGKRKFPAEIISKGKVKIK